MKIYDIEDGEHAIDELLKMMEEHTDQKIFTMRVLEQTKKGLEVLVVFEDKSIMNGLISVKPFGGKLAMRVQGNFI